MRGRASPVEKSIIAKLRHLLTEPIDSEGKVVYVLAESRKLLETYPLDAVPFALKLYCHWALHVDLDNPKTTLPFLEQAEEYAARVLAGNKDIAEESRMLREFVFLDTFRQQFKQFLEAYGLPTETCDSDDLWHEFLTHYAGVIEDGSLSCRAKAHPLKLISEIIFARGRAVENHYLPFALVWTIVLLDGRKLTTEVKASAPNGYEMIAIGTTLH
jgi:hypothetical protein